MAVLWLHSLGPLYPPSASVGARLRYEILRNLTSWATWNAEGSAVQWTDRPLSAGIYDTDCVVYFVPNYRDGLAVVRTRREINLAGLHLVLLGQASLGDPVHLGTTILDPPALSEVWTMDLLRWSRDAPLGNTIWSESDIRQAGYALAASALHEVMHNKIESLREDEWELHQDGGGGMAAPLSRLAMKARARPTAENQHLLRLYFGSRRAQYIHRPPPALSPGAATSARMTR